MHPSPPYGYAVSPRRQGLPMMPPRQHINYSKSSAFSSSANADEDWTKIADLGERRRIQNRIAQRNYRKKIKHRLEDLERRAGTAIVHAADTALGDSGTQSPSPPPPGSSRSRSRGSGSDNKKGSARPARQKKQQHTLSSLSAAEAAAAAALADATARKQLQQQQQQLRKASSSPFPHYQQQQQLLHSTRQPFTPPLQPDDELFFAGPSVSSASSSSSLSSSSSSAPLPSVMAVAAAAASLYGSRGLADGSSRSGVALDGGALRDTLGDPLDDLLSDMAFGSFFGGDDGDLLCSRGHSPLESAFQHQHPSPSTFETATEATTPLSSSGYSAYPPPPTDLGTLGDGARSSSIGGSMSSRSTGRSSSTGSGLYTTATAADAAAAASSYEHAYSSSWPMAVDDKSAAGMVATTMASTLAPPYMSYGYLTTANPGAFDVTPPVSARMSF